MAYDYRAQINAEKAKGDKADINILSQLEAQRNDKIAGLNAGGANTGGYTQTYNYTTAKAPTVATNTNKNIFGENGDNGSQADYLNQLYAQKRNDALNSLKSAYDLNTIDLNASASKIPEMYYNARNQTSGASAQNQSAFNERAAASGLNSGAGGQASLAIGNTLTNNLGALNKQEAMSLADIETQRAKLNAQYQSQVAQTTSSNNIALMQALYDESVRSQNQQIDNQRYQDSLNNNNLATEKAEYADNQMTHYQDYQAEINNVLGDNDPTNDWKADKLLGWRNEKLLAQEAAALKAAKSYGGGTYSGSGTVTDNTPLVEFNGSTQSQLYSGKLADAAASYQVGMNRTAQGQLATVQKLLTAGQITEAQAQALINKFNLG